MGFVLMQTGNAESVTSLHHVLPHLSGAAPPQTRHPIFAAFLLFFLSRKVATVPFCRQSNALSDYSKVPPWFPIKFYVTFS